MSASAGRPSMVRRAAAGLTAALAVAAVSVGSVVATPPASAQTTGIEVVGDLPHPCDDAEDPPRGSARAIIIVGIDTDARRLYTKYDDCDRNERIGVYDISTDIPTFLHGSPPIDTDVRTWTSYTVLIASDLGRMFVLGLEGTGDQMIIEVLDLDTLEIIETWEMTGESDPREAKTPGFVPMGLDYDAEGGRIYLVGTLHANKVVDSVVGITAGGTVPTAAIAAIDAESGDQLWINPLRGCDAPLNSAFHGALVAKSAARPMLYAFCVAGAAAAQRHGQGGIIRLDVRDQDDAEGVVDFPSDFFPVSGDYTTGDGVAALEPQRERFVAQSLSSDTHGAWVFDGHRDSWIGFVAAPDDTNEFYGLDSVSGKHYMGGEGTFNGSSGYINVTDVGATPVPQGRRFDDFRSTLPWTQDMEAMVEIQGNMQVDPATGRIFASYYLDGGQVRGALVLRDTTPPITPRTPLDLDELTHDLPDDEALLEFSANASGFGAQYIQVGGWQNVWTRPTVPISNARLSDEEPNPADLRYGNRGATMSLVEGIGVSQSGASASAIVTRPDDNTPGDAETKQNDAEDQANDATDGGFEDLSEAVDDASSDDDDSGDDEVEQVRSVTCLDGADDDEAVSDEQGSEGEPAHAKVVCDLTNLKASALARFSGGSGGGGVVVSDSQFDGKTYRDPKRGVVTEAEAIAEGIFFGEAEVGGFSIDRVTSTATTWATGLDGKSHVKWVRTVEGMRTIEADGTTGEPTSCTTIIESGKEPREEGEADCKSLQKDLNELMPNRFEVRFPFPEVVATPGGAFASVQETETDYLSGRATNNDDRRMVPGMEMTVFADGDQRGRLWVQLAAVKADATFIRSEIHESSSGGSDVTQTSGGTSGGPSTDGPTAPAEDSSGGETVTIPAAPPDDVPPPEAADPPTTPVSHQGGYVGAFGWLPALRSAGDAALTGALYVLFLLPAAEVVRRRRLLDVLTDAPAGEAPRAPANAPTSLSISPARSTS